MMLVVTQDIFGQARVMYRMPEHASLHSQVVGPVSKYVDDLVFFGLHHLKLNSGTLSIVA
jgi:hypothetical protein